MLRKAWVVACSSISVLTRGVGIEKLHGGVEETAFCGERDGVAYVRSEGQHNHSMFWK